MFALLVCEMLGSMSQLETHTWCLELTMVEATGHACVELKKLIIFDFLCLLQQQTAEKLHDGLAKAQAC